MSEGDLPEVLLIENGSFPRPWTLEQFLSELKNPVSYAYVLASASGKKEVAAGYILFWAVRDESHILNLAVRQDFRRRGCAAALLTHALKIMKRNMVLEVFLEVRRSNAAAQRLYEKFGFRESYVRKDYYGNEDAVVMARTL